VDLLEQLEHAADRSPYVLGSADVISRTRS
jgi:hypothetical protein